MIRDKKRVKGPKNGNILSGIECSVIASTPSAEHEPEVQLIPPKIRKNPSL
jgi:hypothetical protein